MTLGSGLGFIMAKSLRGRKSSSPRMLVTNSKKKDDVQARTKRHTNTKRYLSLLLGRLSVHSRGRAVQHLKHTNKKSGLFLISNCRRVLNVVFFGKSDLSCFMWTKEEKSSWCIMEAAVEDSMFDSRKCRRCFFSETAYLF